MLYVRQNEHTNRLKIVLITNHEIKVPEKLSEELDLLDRAYPEIDVEFVTLEGNSVVITIDGGMVMVNDATVIAADIETYNGVVHVIDRVLTLPNNIEDAQGTAFNAYPIPADAVLNLEVSSDTQLLGVRLVDMQGRVALELQQGNVRTLDVSALPAGVYTLQVLTAQGQSQKAVVIR